VQSFDCGPAALATLLSAHVARPVGLAELTDALMLSQAESVRIQTTGYSLQQLVEMADSVGVRARIAAVPQGSLSKLLLPVLVYLQLPAGPHFSVLSGVAGDRVLLTDPSQGNLFWTRGVFVKAWAPEGEGVFLSLQ
jgi:predicted double-glycine peptidase